MVEEPMRITPDKKKKRPRVAKASHPKAEIESGEGEYTPTTSSDSEKE
jgi:hypothetical protein